MLRESYEASTALALLARRLAVAAFDRRYDAVFLARGDYALDRRIVLRFFLFDLGLPPHSKSQISRPVVVSVHPGRADGAVGARGVAARRHGGRGFRAIADHRHDDALHPGVERLADDPGLVRRYTREWNCGTPAFDGAQHLDHLSVVHQPMLLIDAD